MQSLAVTRYNDPAELSVTITSPRIVPGIFAHVWCSNSRPGAVTAGPYRQTPPHTTHKGVFACCCYSIAIHAVPPLQRSPERKDTIPPFRATFIPGCYHAYCQDAHSMLMSKYMSGLSACPIGLSIGLSACPLDNSHKIYSGPKSKSFPKKSLTTRYCVYFVFCAFTKYNI